MTTEAAIQVQGLEVVQGPACAKGRGLRRGAVQHFRAARLKRDGQDHGCEDLVHAAQGRRGDRHVNGFDVATQAADVRESISLTGQFAAVDEILTGRRTSCWSPTGTSRIRCDRGWSARALLAERRCFAEGGDVFGWHAPPPRHRDEPHRNPRSSSSTSRRPGSIQARIEVWQAVPELAEQGTTVLLTTQYLDEAEQLADRIAILHEADHRERHPHRAQAAAPAGQGRIRREAADPRGRLPRIVGEDGKAGDAAMTAGSAQTNEEQR